jgi:uncharacterized membrane protein YgcG
MPIGEIQTHYSAGPLPPGKSFVLTIPLVNSGSLSPVAIDNSRPPGVLFATTAIIVIFALIAFGFLVRERNLGRFAVIDPAIIDSSWIEKNIVVHPAEVVGAAWDGRVGTPEVVALIARMTAEGKLESEVTGKDSMTLRLKVDRNNLDGYERALVNNLFFNSATVTSTKEVRQHYKNEGFNRAKVIQPELDKQVKRMLPSGKTRVGFLPGIALFVAGLAFLISTVIYDPVYIVGLVAGTFAVVILATLGRIPGWVFRARIDWGMQAAALLMIPAFSISLVAAAFLWFAAGILGLPWTAIAAIASWALCVSYSSINSMKSQQNADTIAFRKQLVACRTFFKKELTKPRPNLSDSWYPWILAFGLGKQVDNWSRRNAPTTADSFTSSNSTTHTSPSGPTATGFSGGGGLSGGAGATGSWAAAAAGLAAGVSAPGSSSSDGGASSSSAGSSGGGGGGGW